jgi:GNAT superfamily N-acetyltransferase
MRPGEDAARRRRFFRADGGFVTNLVTEEDDGRVTGWAALGPYRTQGDIPLPGPPDGGGELYSLYVHPDRHGTGTGRALMAAALAEGVRRGWPRMLLWVLEGNAHARRFYEKAGFAYDGLDNSFEIDGVTVPEVRYVRSLAGLEPAED